MTERAIQCLIAALTAGPEHKRLYAALILRAGSRSRRPRVGRSGTSRPTDRSIAVGSVDEDSAARFIRSGACAVMAEGWLLADAPDGGSLDEFGQRARRLVTAVAASLTAEQRDG